MSAVDGLEPSARRLLDAFAAADPVPGAGSAVALTGALAAALVCAVARATRDKAERGGPALRERYGPFATRADQIAAQARGCLAELTRHVQEDAARVSVAIEHRRRRDAATDPAARDEAERAAREALRHATEIPRRVADLGVTLAGLAAELAAHGYRAATADALAAASLAGASAEGAVALALDSARRARDDAWGGAVTAEARELVVRLAAVRAQLPPGPES